MRDISFTFQRFDIMDVHCGHKVGTDGVLLGVWTSCPDAGHILDVGCGCGLVALILAQRSNARITALEIDPGAYADACSNVGASPWSNRIKVLNQDFCDYEPTTEFDLIVSNPPFFSEPLHSPDLLRAQARHEGSLNYRTLIDFASRNLTADGCLSMIYNSGISSDIIYYAEIRHLKLRRHCLLRNRTASGVVRELYEFSPTDGPIDFEDIAIRDENGKYTDKYAELTKDFYIK